MHPRALLLAAALALLAAGCASGPGPRGRGAERRPMDAMAPRLFVSPAGKVFRAVAAGERPIEAWFAEADADHDGALTYPEFQADFARAFASFDLDGNGEIDPAEVSHYETITLPEMASAGRRDFGGAGMRRGGPDRAPGGGRGQGGMRGGGPRGGGGGGGGGGGAMFQGAARFGLLAISHPIMDADEDFNRGVTRAEFDRAAGRRFVMLDVAHSGRLLLPDLIARRPGPRGNGVRPRGRRDRN